MPDFLTVEESITITAPALSGDTFDLYRNGAHVGTAVVDPITRVLTSVSFHQEPGDDFPELALA